MSSLIDPPVTGKTIFEDDSFLVIWSKGLFKLSAHPLFAKIYVYSKFRNQYWLINKREKAFFMEVLLFFKGQLGEASAIRVLAKTDFFNDFCNAVATGPKSVGWLFFFKQKKPQECAREYFLTL